MAKGQLAILPTHEGRAAERRIMNLAAHLRDPGARISDVEVVNLSINGFMGEGDLALEIGTQVWLKLPGLEPKNCRVVWVEEGKAGFEFASPLHPATIDLLKPRSKSVRRAHFGTAAARN